MVLKVIALCLCLVLLVPSSTTGHPWRYSQPQESHAESEQIEKRNCTTVRGPSLENSFIETVLDVCDDNRDGVCVEPGNNLPPCCLTNDILLRLSKSDFSQTVVVRDVTFTVRMFFADQGACFVVDSTTLAAPLCNPNILCVSLPSQALSFCEHNLAGPEESACSDDVCDCKDGFDPEDGCCSCLQGYRPSGGQCLRNQVCGCCSSGTVNGANDCDLNGNCNCKEGYDPGNGCCSCLPGYSQSGFRGQCLACGCCTSGTVNNADRCDGFGQCQCSLQFGGEKCCEALSTDVYFILDTSYNFQTSKACEIEYAIMEIISGVEDSVGDVNFYTIINPNEEGGEAVLLHSSDDQENVCSHIEALADDGYIIAGNPYRDTTFLQRGRYVSAQHAKTLQLLETELDSDRRSVAVLITGGRSSSISSEEELKEIADKLLDFWRLDIIAVAIDLTRSGTDRRMQLRRDFGIIAPNPDNRIYLGDVNAVEITDQILHRFESLHMTHESLDATQILNQLNIDRSVTLGGRLHASPASAYCDCHNTEMSITTATKCTPGQLTRVEPPCLPSTGDRELEREILQAVEQVLAKNLG